MKRIQRGIWLLSIMLMITFEIMPMQGGQESNPLDIKWSRCLHSSVLFLKNMHSKVDSGFKLTQDSLFNIVVTDIGILTPTRLTGSLDIAWSKDDNFKEKLQNFAKNYPLGEDAMKDEYPVYETYKKTEKKRQKYYWFLVLKVDITPNPFTTISEQQFLKIPNNVIDKEGGSHITLGKITGIKNEQEYITWLHNKIAELQKMLPKSNLTFSEHWSAIDGSSFDYTLISYGKSVYVRTSSPGINIQIVFDDQRHPELYKLYNELRNQFPGDSFVKIDCPKAKVNLVLQKQQESPERVAAQGKEKEIREELAKIFNKIGANIFEKPETTKRQYENLLKSVEKKESAKKLLNDWLEAYKAGYGSDSSQVQAPTQP